MFKPNKLKLAILSATLLPVMVQASDLAPVKVTADAEAAQQITVDKQTVLETGNTETGSALRQIPGVDAARMGGHGVDLNIRGQNETQLNILIDGAKIEGGCPNRMDPPTSYAELSSMDEVTVIKGIKSVTYGTGGTGGTVLFERKTPTFTEDKAYNGEINLGATNNGLTRDMNATVSAGGDKGYIVLQGASKSADNYEDGNGDEVRSSYETRQAHIDLGWTPNANNEIRLSHENVRTEDALFDGALMDAPLSDGTTTRLRYKGKNIAKNIQAIEADVYRSQVDHLMDNYSLRDAPEGPAAPADFRENATDVETKGAKIKLTSQFGHTSLDYGVQIEAINKLSTLSNATSGKDFWLMWPDVQSVTKSVFAESTSLFKNNQKVILGLRYDDFTSEAKDADVVEGSGKSAAQIYNTVYGFNDDAKNTQSNVNGLIRYERTLDNGMDYYAGLSRTHRYPDATELFIVKATGWVGNPDLDAEQHNQFDMGISGKTQDSTWAVSAYYDRVNNYILRDKGVNQGLAGDIIYVNKNATIRGLEASATHKLTGNIDIAANINFVKGTNESDGENLSDIPPVSGNINALYSASNWDLGARWNFAKDQTEVNEALSEIETAGWSTIDLYGNYQINKTIRLSAGVDNLFDKAYENYLNRIDNLGGTYKVYEPDRTAWVRLNAKF